MITSDEVMEALDVVLQVVLPDEARGTADRALEALREHHSARSAAVFIPMAGTSRLRPFAASANLDKSELAWAQTVWCQHHEALERGAWQQAQVAGRAYLLAPLFHGGALTALLFMDSDAPEFLAGLDRERILLLGRILAASAAAAEPLLGSPDLKEHLVRASADQMRQAHLLVVLEECRGVIKRAAKRIGVSRPTIYKWARRYGIDLDDFRHGMKPAPNRVKPGEV